MSWNKKYTGNVSVGLIFHEHKQDGTVLIWKKRKEKERFSWDIVIQKIDFLSYDVSKKSAIFDFDFVPRLQGIKTQKNTLEFYAVT